jgi:hypothetical protein
VRITSFLPTLSYFCLISCVTVYKIFVKFGVKIIFKKIIQKAGVSWKLAQWQADFALERKLTFYPYIQHFVLYDFDKISYEVCVRNYVKSLVICARNQDKERLLMTVNKITCIFLCFIKIWNWSFVLCACGEMVCTICNVLMPCEQRIFDFSTVCPINKRDSYFQKFVLKWKCLTCLIRKQEEENLEIILSNLAIALTFEQSISIWNGEGGGAGGGSLFVFQFGVTSLPKECNYASRHLSLCAKEVFDSESSGSATFRVGGGERGKFCVIQNT